MTQAKNTAITKWLKNIADSKKETEDSCHDNDSNYWIGNPGKPINDEIRQEIEEARRAAFTKGFAKNSANFEDINFSGSLEDWQLYAISALCCYLAGLWADPDLDIHNNPDIEMYFAANASALYSRNGFLDAEPEIYVTSIELIRLLLKEVESEETSEREDIDENDEDDYPDFKWRLYFGHQGGVVNPKTGEWIYEFNVPTPWGETYTREFVSWWYGFPLELFSLYEEDGVIHTGFCDG